MAEIKTLIITKQNWCNIYDIPDNVISDCISNLEELSEGLYDVTIIDTQIKKQDFDLLRRVTKAYTVFYTENVILNHDTELFLKSRKSSFMKLDDVQSFYYDVIKYYFSKPYGEKYKNENLIISTNFKGSVSWNSGFDIELSGDFGDDFSQTLYYKNRIPIFKGQSIEFYFEYKKTGLVSVELEISQYAMGSVSNRLKVYTYTEEQLCDLVVLENQFDNTNIFVSIKAKGKGSLTVITLHDRYSRNGHGIFLPGGERYVSSRGEEIFAYFDPADMTPPLNVYFSGFKTQEGFEGYNMMKRMGCPFLLISEARLSGGAFYFGDDEYEQMIADVILSKANELGFENEDIILSGMSMGTTGALYYSADISPHAVIIGKPLASIGNVARNELTIRPGFFPTSLDVLKKHTDGTGEEEIFALNRHMWDKISLADYSNTLFAIAYMMEDDYDTSAYKELINNLSSAGVIIYGKGLHGRHNDRTSAIVSWFVERYKSILREDFKRDI